MGADDRNEGAGPGECVEHIWVVQGVTLDGAGAYVDQACERCGAVQMVGPDEITGRAAGSRS